MGKKTFTQAPLTGEYEPLPQWGNLPGVREILGTVPLLNVERNSRGQWMITDRSAYTIESLIPVFARLSRVKPQEDDYVWSESKSLKSLGTTISLLTGLGLRFNTPLEKHNAQISQMFDQRAQRSVARSLEGF